MRQLPHCLVHGLRRARRLSDNVSFRPESFGDHEAHVIVVVNDHYRRRDNGRVVRYEVHGLKLNSASCFASSPEISSPQRHSADQGAATKSKPEPNTIHEITRNKTRKISCQFVCLFRVVSWIGSLFKNLLKKQEVDGLLHGDRTEKTAN